MTPETTEAVTGTVLSTIAWALSLDACIILLLLIIKVLLFAGIIILVSRNEAHRSRKFFVFMVFFLGSILALLNPASDPAGMTRAVLTAVFIGTFLVKKVCWIDIEKAFLATFLYCLLTIALNIYSTYGLDLLIKDRPTIGRFLAARLDERTLRASGSYTFDPSPTLLSAVLRSGACSSPNETGLVHTLFAPIRAGMKAKETIAEVSLIAEDQAAIVNMLSGAGTNVGSRADELQALRSQMGQETAAAATPLPAGEIPPPPPQRASTPTSATKTPPTPVAKAAPESTKAATPTAVLADALTKGLKLLPIDMPAKDTEQQGSHTDTTVSVVSVPSPADDGPVFLPTEEEHQPPATNIQRAVVDVPSPTKGSWADIPPADRRRWSAARESIKITAAGRSSKSAYVMVDGQFIGLGSIYSFDFAGTNYAFRLTEVEIPRHCEWEPVPDAPPVVDETLLTF